MHVRYIHVNLIHVHVAKNSLLFSKHQICRPSWQCGDHINSSGQYLIYRKGLHILFCYTPVTTAHSTHYAFVAGVSLLKCSRGRFPVDVVVGLSSDMVLVAAWLLCLSS